MEVIEILDRTHYQFLIGGPQVIARLHGFWTLNGDKVQFWIKKDTFVYTFKTTQEVFASLVINGDLTMCGRVLYYDN